MVKFVKFFMVNLFIFLIASCSSVSTTYDYDPAEDFSKLKTYSWFEGQIPGDALAENPLIQKRVKEAIDKELAAKGYELKEGVDVDFIVVTHAGTKERMQVTDWGSYGWYHPWWGPYGGRTDVSYYKEGSLVIDIVNAKEKELSWRGIGTKTIEPAPTDPQKAQAKIDQIVMKILANFPPPAK